MNCLSILLWIAGFNLFCAKPIENIEMAKEVGSSTIHKLFPDKDYSGQELCIQSMEADDRKEMYIIEYAPIGTAAKAIKAQEQGFILETWRFYGTIAKVYIDKETGKIVTWGNTGSTIAGKKGLRALLGV